MEVSVLLNSNRARLLICLRLSLESAVGGVSSASKENVSAHKLCTLEVPLTRRIQMDNVASFYLQLQTDLMAHCRAFSQYPLTCENPSF